MNTRAHHATCLVHSRQSWLAVGLVVTFLIGFIHLHSLAARPQELVYDHIDPATGYRTERYQAAVPETPPAGKRVFIEDIDRLIANEKAVLVDVSPITGMSYDPATGRWRTAKRHSSLPGAIWLPEVGRGVIDASVERFFHTELDRLSGGNKTHPIILFCNADCWMSWNAMKRAAGFGYTRLYWFPEGIDGWSDWDRQLVPIEPKSLTLHR